MTGNTDNQDSRALEAGERVRLMRDGLINNSASVISAIVGIVLVPIMLKGLGAETYSLWIAALAVLGLPAGFDLGLGATVVREVGARGMQPDPESTAFVQAAGNAYLFYGVLGALVIAAVGLPLSFGLHLTPDVQPKAATVFALTGVSFFAEQQLAFASATLRGLRRFGVLNSLVALLVLLRAGGIIALLLEGKSIVALMAWYSLSAVLIFAVAWTVVGHLDSSLRVRFSLPRWKPLRSHVSFALASQLIRILIQMIWETGPLLVGLVLGSVWMVPFYIGEKFPYTTAGATWRAAEVLFPAASRDERTQNTQRTRETLELGTRWIVALAVPACIVFWTIGPEILHLWVGEVSPDAIRVLRLMTGVLLVDALGLSAMSILWGYGRARPLATVMAAIAIATVGLSIPLLRVLGVPAVALAMLLSIAAGSIVLTRMAAKMCGIGTLRLIRESFQGLWIPFILTAAVAAGIVKFIRIANWLEVIGSCAAIGLVYLISFYLSTRRPEERDLIRHLLGGARPAED